MTERCNCDASCGENRYHNKGDSGCRYEAPANGGLAKAVAAIGPDRDEFVPTPFDPAWIKPPRGEMNGSGKYSPNLFRWAQKWVSRYAGWGAKANPAVFRAGDKTLWIGRIGDDGWFSGAKLMRVLCNGASQEIYAVAPSTARGFKPLPNFWRAYRRIGRCAIDKDHSIYWQEDDARWEVKGKKRSCRWCGKFHQRLQVRTEIKRTVVKKWVKA